jgi:hypothetical protein
MICHAQDIPHFSGSATAASYEDSQRAHGRRSYAVRSCGFLQWADDAFHDERREFREIHRPSIDVHVDGWEVEACLDGLRIVGPQPVSNDLPFSFFSCFVARSSIGQL